MKRLWFSKQKILYLTLVLAACGSGGNGDSGTPEAVVLLPATPVTVTGSIKSVSGSQSEMKDWIVAMVNYDLISTSVGVINAAGNFSLTHIFADQRYSLVLLDPQYKVAAVLSSAGTAEKTIKQVFKITGTQLPILVHNGPIINFTNLSNVILDDKVTAADDDKDLIPNGKETALVEPAAPIGIDTDKDGMGNATDPDIDGDGVMNIYDLDDDGDATPDAFDVDANGDSVIDTTQTVGDLYFPTLLSYGSVQVLQDTQSDGSFSTSLLFSAKTSDLPPTTLKIRGANNLFENSLAVKINAETGDEIKQPFDFSLMDDGLNEDGAAGDGTYVRRVQLAPGKLPKAQQVVFFQFSDLGGIEGAARTYEFPFMFPDVVSGAIGGTYTASSRTITLTGTPFGALKTYKWIVNIYESSGKKAFVSEPIDGAAATYVIPSGVLDPTATYTAKIVATSPERLPSYPTWIVKSSSFNL